MKDFAAVRGSAAKGWRSCIPVGRDWPLLGGYMLAFAASHFLAALWGSSGYYSLWYPAAGFRFAVLWHRGARLTLALTIAELAVQLATGIIDPNHRDWLTQAINVARPPLAYGLAIALVRHAARDSHSSLSAPPMPFALAAVAAPLVAMLATLPWSLLRPDITRVETLRDVISSLAAFAVGDLLGVLLIAPPLLWLAERPPDAIRSLRSLRAGPFLESAAVLGAGLFLVSLLVHSGLGIPTAPVLLAVAWIGLRFGRLFAWLAILIVSMLTLPATRHAGTAQALVLHMGLASATVIGYLSGSFADAQARARRDLAKRDRILFQAERLKTLRAMSVAIIHEISQPLSTLAIETKHLGALVRGGDPEIQKTAQLIERKTNALAELVRRLRSFGGRSAEQPAPVSLASLVANVEALVRPEAGNAGVPLDVRIETAELFVTGHEVELTQALLNLVRNAIQAAKASIVTIEVVAEAGFASIFLTNSDTQAASGPGGMGVGALVARTIVEAHGGSLTRELFQGRVVHRIILPISSPD
jgi:signal transduction histidine kinase